jgi:hypothetical protein
MVAGVVEDQGRAIAEHRLAAAGVNRRRRARPRTHLPKRCIELLATAFIPLMVRDHLTALTARISRAIAQQACKSLISKSRPA